MTSFLGAAVRTRGQVFGRLYLTEKNTGGPFTNEDEIVVHTLAGADCTLIAVPAHPENTPRPVRSAS